MCCWVKGREAVVDKGLDYVTYGPVEEYMLEFRPIFFLKTRNVILVYSILSFRVINAVRLLI